MSHEIEVIDGRGSMAFQGKVPWHGLGVKVDSGTTAEEMLQIANADYEVFKTPVLVEAVADDAAITQAIGAYMMDASEETRRGLIDALTVPVDERFATARISPVSSQVQPFEVMKGRYHVVQNAEILAKALAMVEASGGDAVVETVAVMKDGARFFVTIDLGKLIIDPAGIGDEIKRYMLWSSSHDGSLAITGANTDIRVVCANTERMALDGAESVFRARHTPNVDDRFQEAKRVLGLSTTWAQEFKAEAEALLRIPVSEDQFTQVLDAVWPEAKADTDRKKANRNEVVNSVRMTWHNERNIALVGQNGWSAYNAVTEFLDHHRALDPLARALSTLDEAGQASRLKVKAQQAIKALV